MYLRCRCCWSSIGLFDIGKKKKEEISDIMYSILIVVKMQVAQIKNKNRNPVQQIKYIIYTIA